MVKKINKSKPADCIIFEVDGRKSYFGIKNEKWTFWTDDDDGLDIDDIARVLFGIVRANLDKE